MLPRHLAEGNRSSCVGIKGDIVSSTAPVEKKRQAMMANDDGEDVSGYKDTLMCKKILIDS